jgi:hypothetical protein
MPIRPLPMALIGSAYLGCHLLLESLSNVHPPGAFGITAWNPSTGLSIVLILTYGRAALPHYLMALAPAGMIVRGSPPLAIGLVDSAIRFSVYGCAALTLLRPEVGFDRSLSSVRDLFLLCRG